jgi:uncharacterized protein YjbJ (UPF0337 family)
MDEENIKAKGQSALESFVGNIKDAYNRLMGHGHDLEEKARAGVQQRREAVERATSSEKREGAAQEIGGEAKRGAGEALGRAKETTEAHTH